MKYSIKNNEKNTEFIFNRLLDNNEISIIINKDIDNSWPVLFYTATTDIRDFIGNIKKINNNKCSVEGYYRDGIVTVDGVLIIDKKINSIGQRVMVTEHVNIEGKLELIATTKRILYKSDPNLNFINIGYSNNNECKYFRIDAYLGKYKQCQGQAISKG